MLRSIFNQAKLIVGLTIILIIGFTIVQAINISKIISDNEDFLFTSGTVATKNSYSSSYKTLFGLEDNPFKTTEIFDEFIQGIEEKKLENDTNKSSITETTQNTAEPSIDNSSAIQKLNNVKTLVFPKSGEVYKKMNMGDGKIHPGIIASKDSFPLEMGMPNGTALTKGHIGQTIAKLNKLYPDNNSSIGKFKRGELAYYMVNGERYYCVAVSKNFAKAGDIIKCYTTSKSVPYIMAFVTDVKNTGHSYGELVGDQQLQGEIGHAYLINGSIIQIAAVEFFTSTNEDTKMKSAQALKYGEFMRENNFRYTKIEIVGRLK